MCAKTGALSSTCPAGSAIAVAMIEVTSSQDAKTYVPASIGTAPPFDYLWFTPAQEAETTCERLRKKGLVK